MNQKASRIQSVIIMFFAWIGFYACLNFLAEKFKLWWLLSWVMLVAPIVLFGVGLVLRDIRSRGWH